MRRLLHAASHRSFLAPGAIVGAASAMFDPHDTAAACRANLSVLSIDPQFMLVLARTAVKVASVGNGGAPFFNSFFQNAAGQTENLFPFAGG